MSISSNPPSVEGNQNITQVPNTQDPPKSPDALALFQQTDQNNVSIPSVPLLLPRYEWENKWLKGDEYAFMLQNIDRYCAQFDLKKFERKTHPENIYRSPQNGMIYFVEGNCVGSEFGFPRVPFRKQYRWKKMNFTTDLPKKRPQVTYIVASSVRCSKHGNSLASGNQKNNLNASEVKDIFRMHAVILYKSQETKEHTAQEEVNQEISQKKQQYILCHIRKIDLNETERNSLPVGVSSSNEQSAEMDQIKSDQSEDEEDEDNNLNLESNKQINTKRKSISQNSQAKNDLSSKTSKAKSKDNLKLQIKQLQNQQSTSLNTNNIPETHNLSTNLFNTTNPALLQGNQANITTSNCCQGFRKLSECSGKNGCQAHESPTLVLQACHVNKATNEDNKIRILTNPSEQLLNNHNHEFLQAHQQNHRKGSSNSSSISNPQQPQYINLPLHTKQQDQQHYQQQQQQLLEQQQMFQKQQQVVQNPFVNTYNTFYPSINSQNNHSSMPISNSNLNNLSGLQNNSFVLGSPLPPVSQLPSLQFPQQTPSPLSGLQIQLMLLMAQQNQQQQQQAQIQQQQQLQQEHHYQQQLLQLQQSMPNTPEKNLFNLLTLWQQNPQFGDLLYNFLQRQLPGQEIDYHNLFSLSHSPNPPTTLMSSQPAGLINNFSLQQINNNSNSLGASLLDGESVTNGNLSRNNKQNNNSSINSDNNNQINPQ